MKKTTPISDPKAGILVPLLFFILLLSGCAAPYTIGLQKLQEKDPCCEAISELGFDKLHLSQSIGFEVGELSRAYNFETGKSFFAAYELPYYVNTYSIMIRSFMIGDQIDKAYIFFPHVITLDKDYRVVRTFGKESFKLKKTLMGESWGLKYKLEGRIEFEESDMSEKYIIVMTTEEMLLMKSSIETMKLVPLVMPGLVTAMPFGRKETIVPHAPVGRLRLTVTSSSARKGPLKEPLKEVK
ncbi:MAG: hypothetical protein A2054_10040 [Deltaproteobacteria bacterium GWA2_55_10]|nr:MAG: hypothetical protein A2054_10040 [Deltaproteobacteria bacterium GWA2_55_10]